MIDETDVIDFTTIDEDEARLILTDHLPWSLDRGDPALFIPEPEHIFLLRAKMKRYLDFIASGEVYAVLPEARGLSLVVDVVLMHDPSAAARRFFADVEGDVSRAGATLRVTVFREDEGATRH